VLLHVEQNVRGHEFRKWILVAGDAANTVMLTASVPQSLAGEVGPMLRPVLMTATWDRGAIGDPRAGLGFEFTETADLKVARGMGATTVVLTRGGDSARVAFSEPMLVLGKSTAGEVISDLGVFSRARLAKTRTIGEVEVREEKALELAGMPAHELVAAARGARDATPVTVYQALAYDGADYYLIQGFVGPGLEERFLPQFREIARSLKPR
jgi:hypothetical protein